MKDANLIAAGAASTKIGWWYCEGCTSYFSVGADWRYWARRHLERCAGVERNLIVGGLSRCSGPDCRCTHCSFSRPNTDAPQAHKDLKPEPEPTP